MGGQMEISSLPGKGCTVRLEVPVPRRTINVDTDEQGSDEMAELLENADDMQIGRKVHLAGFAQSDRPGTAALEKLGQCLQRQFEKLGCSIVPIEEAELVVADGVIEQYEAGKAILENSNTDDVVFVVPEEHEADPEVIELERRLGKNVRRFRKPTTPSILREALFPGHSQVIASETSTPTGKVTEDVNAPDQVDAHGKIIRHGSHASKSAASRGHSKASWGAGTHQSWSSVQSPQSPLPRATPSPRSVENRPFRTGMDVEDAVASLSLGDYFSSRRVTHAHTPKGSPSGAGPVVKTPGTDGGGSGTAMPVAAQERITVMVVEDNTINRKILVKILSNKLVRVWAVRWGELG
jgi:hypothetical protein